MKWAVNAERVYAAHWLKANKPTAGRPRGILELILRDEDGQLPTVSQRDAEVAASVIQWLGTNVGLGFIKDCERAIERQRDRVDPLFASPSQKPRDVVLTRRIDLDDE